MEKVLLLGSETTTIIGRPIVPGAHVTALLEEHVSDPSVRIIYMIIMMFILLIVLAKFLTTYLYL